MSASSEQIDKTSDALGTSISEVQAKELPLNGRNWSSLTSLQPSAVDTGGSSQRAVRFAGRGRDDDNFTYDGIDATNISQSAPAALCAPGHSARHHQRVSCRLHALFRRGRSDWRSAISRDVSLGNQIGAW